MLAQKLFSPFCDSDAEALCKHAKLNPRDKGTTGLSKMATGLIMLLSFSFLGIRAKDLNDNAAQRRASSAVATYKPHRTACQSPPSLSAGLRARDGCLRDGALYVSYFQQNGY